MALTGNEYVTVIGATSNSGVLSGYPELFTIAQLLATGSGGSSSTTVRLVASGTTDTASASDGMEAQINDAKFAYNGGYGIVWNGSHDSKISDIYLLSNGLGGLVEFNSANATPLTILQAHGYQNGNYDFLLLGPYTSLINSYAESGVEIGSAQNTFINTGVGGAGIVFNCATNGSYYNTFIGSGTNTINNSSGCASSADTWIGGGASSTVTNYAPYSAVIGTTGLGNQTLGNYATFRLIAGSAWPVNFATNASSVFSVQNGGANFMVADANDRVAFGPSVASTVANEELAVTGAIGSAGNVSTNTKFTTSGCSVSATTGGATAGTYTSGTTGTCTVVITMNGATGLTAPNGWTCFANDQTTPADKQQTTASSATTATISGTTVSGDVVSFGCIGY